VIPPAAIELAYRLLPNARVARVPATGHSVYFEQPGLFNSIVDGFFTSLEG
jgi:pimeloyl-ACP methyl ester carboxylesterase